MLKFNPCAINGTGVVGGVDGARGIPEFKRAICRRFNAADFSFRSLE